MRVLTHTVMIEFPYRYVDRLRLLVASHQGENLGEDFAVQVTLTARYAVEHLPPFQEALSELTNGGRSRLLSWKQGRS